VTEFKTPPGPDALNAWTASRRLARSSASALLGLKDGVPLTAGRQRRRVAASRTKGGSHAET
jgi:hypothetical protein